MREEAKTIPVKKMHPDATLPKRAHADDAGLDLYSLEEGILSPGQGRLFRTGIAVKLETGFFGMIADRSSMAKKGIKTAGGIIDTGYRGEIQVVLWNISKDEIRIQQNDRIAQLLVLPFAAPVPFEAADLDATTRGVQGFGSSGQ